MNDLLEKLAELEHDQWMSWSKNLAHNETISSERENKWRELWVPYCILTEEQKEQDRIWARKVLNIVKEHIK